jgi:hypothetical protein
MAAKQVIHFRLDTQPGSPHFPDRCCFNSVDQFPPKVRIVSADVRSAADARAFPSPRREIGQ